MSKFRGIKIRVNPTNNRQVQEMLFAEGARWDHHGEVFHAPNADFLYVYPDGRITYSCNKYWFEDHRFKEVLVEEVRTVNLVFPPEVVEFEGKKYLREEFEKMLALLNPVS